MGDQNATCAGAQQSTFIPISVFGRLCLHACTKRKPRLRRSAVDVVRVGAVLVAAQRQLVVVCQRCAHAHAHNERRLRARGVC